MSEELLINLTDFLKSINGNLEKIASSLERLDKNLGGCVAASGNSRFLCITGNVSTYNGYND